MGVLALTRLMTIQREQRRNRGQIQAQNGSISSLAKRNCSPCRKDDDSQGSKRIRYSGPDLPEEIWHHIYSLVPMRDAARAACVSRTFLHFWRSHPNLTFTEEIMCLKGSSREGTAGLNNIREYNNIIDHVLTNHSKSGVKRLDLNFDGPHNKKSYDRLNSWLKIAVTPGIKELMLNVMSLTLSKYKFPCSFLSDRVGDSIRYILLGNCALHTTGEPGRLRSLTVLHLYNVRTTEDKLGCLLSNSVALEKLMVLACDDIFRLEIPFLLQRLSYLEVHDCIDLQVIENKAPNISSFHYGGYQIHLSRGEWLQLKKLHLDHPNVVCDALDNLPSSGPNLEQLTIHSYREVVNAPMVSRKKFHLNCLNILLGWNFSEDYDYLSLVSLIDASPSLVTFNLRVAQQSVNDSTIGDPSSLRQMPEHHHDNLKSVRITGFPSSKSLVELTLHILENALSLECLTLDIFPTYYRCSDDISRHEKCRPANRDAITEAHKARLVLSTYIEGKVPSAVQLNVIEPCSECHDW